MIDPYYDNVVLMLPFDQDGPGGQGSLDYSKYNQRLVWKGDARLSTAQSEYGEKALMCPGGDSDIVTVLESASLNISSCDFTIEFLFYATALKYYSRLVNINSTWSAGAAGFNWNSSSDNINFAVFNILNPVVRTLIPPSMNARHHIAVTRLGSLFTMWLDGVAQTTATDSRPMFSTETPYITIGNGDVSVGVFTPFAGYIKDLRITSGIARYTANFTPPTALKADYPAPVFTPRLISPFNKALRPDQNADWGGPKTVSGTVKIGAVLVKRRVRLYEANTGVLIREQWSQIDGTYSFTGLRADIDYTVTSTDYAAAYNDVIAARIRAV